MKAALQEMPARPASTRRHATNVKYALSHNVVPSVALVPSAWSDAKPTFHTGKRGVGTTMELPFILGVVTTRSSSTIVALVPSSRQTPAQTVSATGEASPARSDGAQGRGQPPALTGDRGC